MNEVIDLLFSRRPKKGLFRVNYRLIVPIIHYRADICLHSLLYIFMIQSTANHRSIFKNKHIFFNAYLIIRYIEIIDFSNKLIHIVEIATVGNQNSFFYTPNI